MGNKFPNRPAYYEFLKENKGIYLGEKERFGPYVEPEFFKTREEAKLWVKNFLSKQPDAEEFELKIVECELQQEAYDSRFKEKNFYIKIRKMPHEILETRPNLKPDYLREDLVLGRGNTIAKAGNQKWFETEKEAKNHIEQALEGNAFQNFEFKIVGRN